MVTRLLIAALRANPMLTLGIALELGYRAARALRRSTSSRGQVHPTAGLIETTLAPRTGRRTSRPARRRRTVRRRRTA